MISFVETMQGEVDDGTTRRKIVFTVRAEGQGGGHFNLRGVASVDGWATEVETRGTLEMSVFPPRIRYQLRFESSLGLLDLDAEKHPSPLRPLVSMSWMPAALRDAQGKVVAKGEMVFDLNDFSGFAASWLPFRKSAQKQLDARRRAAVRKALA